MPEISRFYGIIIRMYAEPGAPHHRHHFQAYYQNHTAVYSIEPVELIDGALPPGSKDLWKRGQNYTQANWQKHGSGYNPVSFRSKLRLYGNARSKLCLISFIGLFILNLWQIIR